MKTFDNTFNLAKMKTKVTALLNRNKTFNDDVQTLIDNFIKKYETTLSKDSSELDRFLKGIRQTDKQLLLAYFERVTNATLQKNKKGNYVVRYNEDETELKTNENFDTMYWYDLAKKANVTIRDKFVDIDTCLKSFETFFEKLKKSEFDKETTKKIFEKITENFNEIN